MSSNKNPRRQAGIFGARAKIRTWDLYKSDAPPTPFKGSVGGGRTPDPRRAK